MEITLLVWHKILFIVQESIEKVKYHFFPTTMRRWVVQLDWVRPALYKLMFQYITFYSRLLAYRHLSKIWDILTTFSYIIPKFTEELTLSSQNMISNKNLLSSLLFFGPKDSFISSNAPDSWVTLIIDIRKHVLSNKHQSFTF